MTDESLRENKHVLMRLISFIVKGFFTPSANAVVRRGIVVAMSVRPSVRRPSVRRPHFQLSLTAKVSGAFVLYCMVMVPSKGNLRF